MASGVMRNRLHLLGLLNWHRRLSGRGVIMPSSVTAEARLADRLRVGGDKWSEVRAEIASDAERRAPFIEDRAALRRAENVADVMLLPAFIRFARFVQPGGFDEVSDSSRRLAALARCALVCSRLDRVDLSASLGAQFGRTSGGSSPKLSSHRFSGIIQQCDADEVSYNMAQAARICGEANILDIFAVIFEWGTQRGDSVEGAKARLARDYFSAALMSEAPEINAA